MGGDILVSLRGFVSRHRRALAPPGAGAHAPAPVRPLVLLLTACSALPAFAELPPPGTTLRWTVATGGGWSERVFFVLEGARASPRHVVERWTLEVGPADAAGQAPVRWTVRGQGKPEISQYVLWEEAGALVFRSADQPQGPPRPVVVRELPPRPLSMEQVPCTSAMLPGGAGLCAAVAGGPLAAPAFPLSVVVDEGEDDSGTALMSLAVMVMTAGVVIPGYEDTSVVATLDGPAVPPRLSPLLAKWRSGPRTVAALGAATPLEVETAGALLVLAGAPSPALVEALMRRVGADERWSLLRLARQRRLSPQGLLAVVARLSTAEFLGAAPVGDAAAQALENSALVGLEAPLRAGVDGLLAGRFPSLRAAALRWGTAPFEAGVLKALESAALEPGEGGALAALLPAPARARALPRFLERLPDAEGSLVVEGLLEGASPQAAVGLLERVPRWVDRQVTTGQGKTLFGAIPFDEQRARVLGGTMTRAPESARPAVLVEVLRLLVFDDARLQVLRRWPAVLPRLSLAQQEAVLVDFSGTDRQTALEVLAARLEDAPAKALVLAALRAGGLGSNRLAALQVRPALTFDPAEARSVLSSFSSDGDRVQAAAALLGKVPAEAQPALLVDAVRGMTFDDGRVEVLAAAPAVVKRLDAEQRAVVLEAFTFGAERAAALLAPARP